MGMRRGADGGGLGLTTAIIDYGEEEEVEATRWREWRGEGLCEEEGDGDGSTGMVISS